MMFVSRFSSLRAAVFLVFVTIAASAGPAISVFMLPAPHLHESMFFYVLRLLIWPGVVFGVEFLPPYAVQEIAVMVGWNWIVYAILVIAIAVLSKHANKHTSRCVLVSVPLVIGCLLSVASGSIAAFFGTVAAVAFYFGLVVAAQQIVGCGLHWKSIDESGN